MTPTKPGFRLSVVGLAALIAGFFSIVFGWFVAGLVAVGLGILVVTLGMGVWLRSFDRLWAKNQGQVSEIETSHTAVQEGRAQAMETVGEVNKTIEKTAPAIRRLEGLVSGTSDGIDVLNQALTTATAHNRTTLEAHHRVTEVLKAYSDEVAVETSEMKTMLDAIHVIHESAGTKQSSVVGILGRVVKAEEKHATIKKAVDRMVKAAGKMDTMNALISEVAERTNLLAMNAAIEAAHSGVAGRGFAVIAVNVRKLSDETRQNSQAIAQSLAQTNLAITDTAAAADEAIAFFHALSDEIQGIGSIFEELVSGMKALSDGSGTLLSSISRVSALTNDTNEVQKASETSMTKAQVALDTILEIAQSIQSDSSSMMATFVEMLGETGKLGSLGLRTADRIELIGKITKP